MTYAEYEAKINEMVQAPDKIAINAADLLKEIKKDTDSLSGAEEKIKKHESRITELQETNYQLYLRATGDISALQKKTVENTETDEMTAHITEMFTP